MKTLPLLLVTLLVSCLPLWAQEPPPSSHLVLDPRAQGPPGSPTILERPLPQPTRPAPINEVVCTVIAEDEVTKTHVVDEGTTPDGIHHSRYVTDSTEERAKYIRCIVIVQDELKLEAHLPLPQPSTARERSGLIKRFLDTWLTKGLAGVQKEYGRATSAFSATSKSKP